MCWLRRLAAVWDSRTNCCLGWFEGGPVRRGGDDRDFRLVGVVVTEEQGGSPQFTSERYLTVSSATVGRYQASP